MLRPPCRLARLLKNERSNCVAAARAADRRIGDESAAIQPRQKQPPPAAAYWRARASSYDPYPEVPPPPAAGRRRCRVAKRLPCRTAKAPLATTPRDAAKSTRGRARTSALLARYG